MRKENSSEKECVVLSNGEKTAPNFHIEFATRALDYRVNGEKYSGERKETEPFLKDLSPEAILYLASVMGSYLSLSPKNKITSALEVNDNTKPYLFGDFIKKEKPNIRRKGSYSSDDFTSMFRINYQDIDLVSRKTDTSINFDDLIEKRIHEGKRMFAHAEKKSIMESLSLLSLDEKFSLDETDDLLNSGDQLSKNMNKINNTKKKRI